MEWRKIQLLCSSAFLCHQIRAPDSQNPLLEMVRTSLLSSYSMEELAEGITCQPVCTSLPAKEGDDGGIYQGVTT